MMKETDFYREMIQEYSIDDKRVKEQIHASLPSKSFSWRKVISITAMCVFALIGIVMIMPTTRAEVLSWLGVSKIEDYLSSDDLEHVAVPELDKLIVTPASSTTGIVLLPIDRSESKAVNSENALRVSSFLYENSEVSLSRGLYDGMFIYQAIEMNGLSGLYLLETYAGGNTTSVPVNPYMMQGVYGDSLDEAYYTGEKTLYQRPTGWIIYEMSDGKRFGGEIDLGANIHSYLDTLYANSLLHNNLSTAEIKAVEAYNLSFLKKNSLIATAKIYVDDWSPYIDNEGNLTAKVYYYISVTEEDCGYGEYVPDTDLFNADLGQITINMRAYEKINQYTLDESEPYVIWSSDETVISEISWNNGSSFESYDNQVSLAKYSVSLNDLMIEADLGETRIDVLGIHNVRFNIKLPTKWTNAEREAFAFSLRFNTILINGESGNWFPDLVTCYIDQDGSVVWRADIINDVPLNLLQSIQTITFIPALQVVDSMDVYDESGNWIGTLQPNTGYTATSALGAYNTKNSITCIEYPNASFILRIS